MVRNDLAIEAVDLVKRFPKQPGWRTLFRRGQERLVLDGISLATHRGEIFGLLGPNGAGKTTFLKILCTLITPTSGQVRVSGLDVVQNEKQVRQHIGLVYGDQRSFFWRLSLVENLRFYAALYQIPADRARQRIAELIEMVGLRDATNLRMHYFSSGMKQRAAIARGLLSDPEIVLLDEPTTSVDPIAAYQVRHMVRDLIAQDGRRTVLLTTNVMEEAESLCDRIALLNHGRIEMTGSVATLRARFQPDDTYVLAVSGVAEVALRELATVPSVHDLSVRHPDGDRLELEIVVARGSGAIPEVVRRLVGASANVWACSKKVLSLDELFRLTFEQQAGPVEPVVPANDVVAEGVR